MRTMASVKMPLNRSLVFEDHRKISENSEFLFCNFLKYASGQFQKKMKFLTILSSQIPPKIFRQLSF